MLSVQSTTALVRRSRARRPTASCSGSAIRRHTSSYGPGHETTSDVQTRLV